MYGPDSDLALNETNAWVTPLINGLSSAGKIAYYLLEWGKIADELGGLAVGGVSAEVGS